MNVKTPTSFKRITATEMSARLKLTEAFERLVCKHGFNRTEIPRLYPVSESFPGGDRIKLIDFDGEVLCVVDNPIIGLLNARQSELERLCGHADVYSFKGQNRNKFLSSAIITGFSGAEVEAELITVALSVLRDLGVEGNIYLGHTSVLQGIAELYLATRVDGATLRSLLRATPHTDAELALERMLRETASVKGGLTELKGAAEKITNKVSVAGLKSLFDVYEILSEIGLGEKVFFDLSIVGEDFGGLAFEIRDDNGNTLIKGGRYDFGSGHGVCRCVGMTMDPDSLLELYPIIKNEDGGDVVIGVAKGIKAFQSAYKLKTSLTDKGFSVTMLYHTDKENVDAYATAFRIHSAVYVDAEGGLITE